MARSYRETRCVRGRLVSDRVTMAVCDILIANLLAFVAIFLTNLATMNMFEALELGKWRFFQRFTSNSCREKNRPTLPARPDGCGRIWVVRYLSFQNPGHPYDDSIAEAIMILQTDGIRKCLYGGPAP